MGWRNSPLSPGSGKSGFFPHINGPLVFVFKKGRKAYYMSTSETGRRKCVGRDNTLLNLTEYLKLKLLLLKKANGQRCFSQRIKLALVYTQARETHDYGITLARMFRQRPP